MDRVPSPERATASERMRPDYLNDGALDAPAHAAPGDPSGHPGSPDIRLGTVADRTSKREAVTAAALERIRTRATARRRNVFGVVD